jgi:diguanylate cyclase (GGDEF)-like protein
MATVADMPAGRSSSDDATLRSVRRLASLADRAEDPEAVFRGLSEELLAQLQANEIHVHHLAGSGTEAELVVIYLFDGEGRLSYMTPRSERAPGVSWVAATARSFVVCNRRELEASLPRLAEADARGLLDALSSAVLVPLTVRGETQAVVVPVRRDGEVFGQPALEVAETLVGQAANALALLRARAEAGTDPVTHTMNRRAMRQRLNEEIARAHRSDSPLACLLIDLDNFKGVNDRHGHQAGDEVLREVAQALMGEFRAFDRVARYGGDEFVVILPNADLDSATTAAERALDRLQALSSFGDPSGVAASIGAGQWQAPMRAEELLEACDAALLRSKREGKGRVTRAA